MMEKLLMLALKEGSPWLVILLLAVFVWKAAPKLNSYFDRLVTHSIDSGKRRDEAVVAINQSIILVRESLIEHGNADDRRHHALIEHITEVVGDDRHDERNKITTLVQGTFEDQVKESEDRIIAAIHGKKSA